MAKSRPLAWRNDDKCRSEPANGQFWRAGPDGVLSAERAGLLMTVHESSRDGMVRFLVTAPKAPGRRAAMLCGSGTRDDVQAAKAAAERMAARVGLWA